MTSVQEFFEFSNRITLEYEAIVPLLRDPEVVKAARFLAKLDALASEYEFKPIDIMTLLDPGRATRLQTVIKQKGKAPSKRRKNSNRI
ncbi:hypothetical protein M5G20_04285 [Pseudomonas sp. TNT2022 ID1044]|uniref:hypothetical protein n=1 Tax=Pseudomonas sp. TNT2022 ID1044 TaxID=2942636 RepID=UPI00236042A9|nr:hypothetical protein [Pseudomonas sp. TNT2022 ID1044]MDD0995086.1 hypothetical protein [Pseudomonas sp. TNT2022 ID1044]